MNFSRNFSAALFVTTALLFRLPPGVYAQSGVYLENIFNTSTNSGAVTNGLFFVQTNGSAPVLLHQDFNAAFYGGTNATNLSLIATFLLSDGTAVGDNGAGAGSFLDPTGTSRNIPGASSWAYFQIQAWLGSNLTNYAAAAAAGAYCGQSGVFSNSVAGPPSPPPDLTGMPAIVLTVSGGGSSPVSDGGGGSAPGGSPPSGPSGPLDASSTAPCGLWLSVTASNTTSTVVLHNTREGATYKLYSAEVVNTPFTNLEATVIGAAGDTTQTNIAMGSRSNLFFQVTEYRNYVTNTFFPGLDFADTREGVPDSMGAVGPYFCELLNGATTNTAFVVYDKSGVTNLAHTNINGFFAVHDGTDYPTGQMGDPRILYDSKSQCFLASAIDVNGSEQVVLAVCTNASNATNLTGGWTRYLIRARQDEFASDFDTLGLDSNGIYLSVLQVGANAHTIVAIKKPRFIKEAISLST